MFSRHRHAAKQREILERARHTARRNAVRLEPDYFLAEQIHAAGLRAIEAGDHVDHAGLAAAVGSDQAENLPFGNVQRDFLERAQATERELDIAAAQQAVALISLGG